MANPDVWRQVIKDGGIKKTPKFPGAKKSKLYKGKKKNGK